MNSLSDKTPWEIACEWYDTDQIHDSILRRQNPVFGEMHDKIPTLVTSREFAEWMTKQYRLAMAKGVQLGRSET
jgi:hypothetical protein